MSYDKQFINVLLLGLTCMLVFTAFQTLGNIQVSNNFLYKFYIFQEHSFPGVTTLTFLLTHIKVLTMFNEINKINNKAAQFTKLYLSVKSLFVISEKYQKWLKIPYYLIIDIGFSVNRN